MDDRTSKTDTAAWTIGRLLAWTTEYLAERGIEEARLAAEVLLAFATKRPRIELYTHFDEAPDPSVLEKFRGWVRRAGSGEPIAYIVGEREFFSLAFELTRDVLIPRPETETLVEVVLDHCQSSKLQCPDFLDVGVGSGCISIALLVQLPEAHAVGTDLCENALAVAERNAHRHDVANRLTLVQADKLALPADVAPPDGFDVVLSNPPYVRADEVATLAPGVRDYEPRVALTDGADGLSVYRAIGSGSVEILKPGGVVVVEIGDDAGPLVIEAMEKTGSLSHVRTTRDQVVRRDRVLVFEQT